MGHLWPQYRTTQVVVLNVMIFKFMGYLHKLKYPAMHFKVCLQCLTIRKYVPMQIKHTTPTHQWVSNPFLVVIISLTISPHQTVETASAYSKKVLHNLQQNMAFTINNNSNSNKTVGVAALPTLYQGVFMNLTLPVKYDLCHTHISANYYMEYLTFTHQIQNS